MEKSYVLPGSTVDLENFETSYEGELSKKEGKECLEKLTKSLRDLQELLHAEHQQKVLVIASVIVEKLQGLGMQFPEEIPEIDSYRTQLSTMLKEGST